MDCFIKEIFNGNSERSHNQFVRFGKGKFGNRAVLNLQKTSKIKLRGSFEWANDFVEMASEMGSGKVEGIVLSKEDISEIISKNSVQGNSETKKGGLFYQNNITKQELSGNVVKELVDNSYTSLLDIEGKDFNLKIKKKLPKPGKSEGKVDDKFCQLEADLIYWDKIKEAFMLPECKKCRISHIFEITEIVLPKDEKDFEKIRILAKRKGKIIRKLEVDKKEEREEREFSA